MPDKKSIADTFNQPYNKSTTTPSKKEFLSITDSFSKEPTKKYNPSFTYDSEFIGSQENKDFGETSYDEGVPISMIESGDFQKLRGERQGWGAELGNAIGGGIAKIPFTVIGNAASILDFEDYLNTDNEVGNSITAWTEEVKGNIEEATKIYKSNDNTLGSREWWINNGKGLIDSAGGFVLTGAGLGKGVQLLSEISKGSKVIQAAGTVTNAAMLNQAESVPIAMKVFNDSYNIARAKGETDEKAREIAADAAAYSININRVNIPLNLTSAFAFLRPIASTREIAKDFSKKAILGKMALEGAQEYLEEDINMIAEKEAIRKATVGNEYSYDIENTVKDVFSKEGFETGIIGFFGGAVQTGGTELVKSLQKDAPSYDAEGNIKTDELGNPLRVSRVQSQKERFTAQQNSLSKIEKLAKLENVNTIKETLNKVKVTSELLNDIQIASVNNDLETVDKLKNQLLVNQSLDAFKNGTTEDLINLYRSIQRDPSTKEKLGEDYILKSQEAIKEIESLEKVYQKYERLPQINEVFQNRADYFYNLKEADKVKKDLLAAQFEQAREIEVTGYTDPKLIETLVTTQDLKVVQDKFNSIRENVVKLNNELLDLVSEKYTAKTVKKEQDEQSIKTEEKVAKTEEKEVKIPTTEEVVPPTETTTEKPVEKEASLQNKLDELDNAYTTKLESLPADLPNYDELYTKIAEEHQIKRKELIDSFTPTTKTTTKTVVEHEPEEGITEHSIETLIEDSDVGIFGELGLRPDNEYKTTAGRDNDKLKPEQRYFRYLSNNELTEGTKLMVVTKNNNLKLYNQMLEQDHIAKDFESKNKDYQGIWVVFVDKDNNPIYADQSGKVLDKGSAENMIFSRLLSTTGVDATRITDKKAAKENIQKLRTSLLSQKNNIFLPILSKSNGVLVRQETPDGQRMRNPVEGHITTDITKPGLLQLAKVGTGKKVILKNGQAGTAGKLYAFDKGIGYDLIPRRVNERESLLITNLLLQRLGINKLVDDPSSEIEKLIKFGVPKDSSKIDEFTLGVKDGLLYVGNEIFTVEQFTNDSRVGEALSELLAKKFVNINAKIGMQDGFKEPVLNDDNSISYKEWDSYQEFLLSNDGRDPLFSTDLPALDQPRYRNFYVNYDPNFIVHNIDVNESEAKQDVTEPESTEILFDVEEKPKSTKKSLKDFKRKTKTDNDEIIDLTEGIDVSNKDIDKKIKECE